MIEIEKAREWLRIDGSDNDTIIQGLLDAVPDYVEVATGYPVEKQDNEPLTETVTRFLLLLWYNAEQSEAGQLQRVIDNLLKTLTVKARALN